MGKSPFGRIFANVRLLNKILNKIKIKEIRITDFKRFTKLNISNSSNYIKLVVLVGLNGSGKSSLFEAFNHFYRFKEFSNTGDKDYLEKRPLNITNY